MVEREGDMMKYYYLSRPPGIGCQPDGWANREVFSPARGPDDYGRVVHGWVKYEGPLDYCMVWKYDLIPADLGERARFLLAREFIDFGQQGQGQNQQQVIQVVDGVIKEYIDRYGVLRLSATSSYAGSYVLELVCLVIRGEEWAD